MQAILKLLNREYPDVDTRLCKAFLLIYVLVKFHLVVGFGLEFASNNLKICNVLQIYGWR